MMVNLVDTLFKLIPEIKEHHQPSDEIYQSIDQYFKSYFQNLHQESISFGEVKIFWPRVSLGNINSLNFFDLGQMILYKFYEINRNRYKSSVDLGANIGIDSLVMASLGYDVVAVEPDPACVDIFRKIIKKNDLNNIQIIQKAVSASRGLANFVRVKGNTTANHLAGRRTYYGEADFFSVETILFEDLSIKPDLMKINVEGAEKDIVPLISPQIWDSCDTFIELHSMKDREVIFDFFQQNDLNIFSQKINWQKANSVEQLPLNYKEGYIFVSSKAKMPW